MNLRTFAPPNKWLLVLVVAVVGTGAAVIAFRVARSRSPGAVVSTPATVGEQLVWFSPAAQQSISRLEPRISEREEIERAERHNLDEMRRYQQRVLRDSRSETAWPANLDLFRDRR